MSSAYFDVRPIRRHCNIFNLHNNVLDNSSNCVACTPGKMTHYNQPHTRPSISVKALYVQELWGLTFRTGDRNSIYHQAGRYERHKALGTFRFCLPNNFKYTRHRNYFIFYPQKNLAKRQTTNGYLGIVVEWVFLLMCLQHVRRPLNNSEHMSNSSTIGMSKR